MPHISKSLLSLRFYGDDLKPDDITRALECQPDFSVAKGGIWHSPRGREQVARSGTWLTRAAPRSPGDIDGQIAELLGRLTDNLVVWHQLANKFRVDAFCGIFMNASNEGFDLNPMTLSALATRGIILGLDIYGPNTGSEAIMTRLQEPR